MKRVLVFGSLNVDIVQSVSRLPAIGETLPGGELAIYVGGKGANQACAAARLGADVRMAGKIGCDMFAERILRELQAARVQTELIAQSARASGTALIFVLPNGENSIVIAAGANGDIDLSFALKVAEQIDSDDILLCQLETPLEAVSTTLNAAFKRGVMTILDPAPACDLPDELLSTVSILTPNQIETAILLRWPKPPANFDEAAAAANALRARGARAVIVKMGAAGCWVADESGGVPIPGYVVNVRDTTAAGDTFNGALAARLARGATLVEAARFANAAAALSVTRRGSMASIPNLAEVTHFLQTQAT